MTAYLWFIYLFILYCLDYHSHGYITHIQTPILTWSHFHREHVDCIARVAKHLDCVLILQKRSWCLDIVFIFCIIWLVFIFYNLSSQNIDWALCVYMSACVRISAFECICACMCILAVLSLNDSHVSKQN